jgi:hypothetical protein
MTPFARKGTATPFSRSARGALSESQEQALVVAWLDFKGVTYFAVPNGARVRPAQARKLKAEGMRAGAPDLVLVDLGVDGRPVALEMKRAKRAKGAYLSAYQTNMHDAMRKKGWCVLVGRGHADAIAQLRAALGIGRVGA